MKKKILLILMSLFATIWCTQLWAQDEVFPKSDAIWVIKRYPENKQLIYGLSGDTIINDLNYQKLYLLNDTTLTIDDGDIFVAGIRQNDKKVWIQPSGMKEEGSFGEYLLYDFSKSEGEEIIFENSFVMDAAGYYTTFEDATPFLYEETFTRYIEKEEELDTGRLLYLNYWGTSEPNWVWIEGIGSLSGLFFPPLEYTLGYPSILGYILECMKQGNQIKYLDENCTSCFDESTSNTLQKEEERKISIFFNKKERTLEVKSSELFPAIFKLYNLRGDIIISSVLNKDFTSFPIELPQSIYVYMISGENIVIRGKILCK